MRHAAVGCLLGAGLALSAAAQEFVNLDFDATTVDPATPMFTFLDWSDAAPGWNHSDGENTGHLTFGSTHLGFSQTYALLPERLDPAGIAWDGFALAMRSGTLFEHEPRGDFVFTYVAQTGRVPFAAQTLTLLANSDEFRVTLDQQYVPMSPTGLAGEWSGDVSAWAGQLVELRIEHISSPVGQPDDLVLDEIRFLPVPEPSTFVLGGLGLLAVAAAGRRAKRRAAAHH